MTSSYTFYEVRTRGRHQSYREMILRPAIVPHDFLRTANLEVKAAEYVRIQFDGKDIVYKELIEWSMNSSNKYVWTPKVLECSGERYEH